MNGTTKANLLKNYGLAALCQYTVGEWIIKLGFKYNDAVNKNYVGGHKNKDAVWYRLNFIHFYLLLRRCIFRCIQTTTEDSGQ